MRSCASGQQSEPPPLDAARGPAAADCYRPNRDSTSRRHDVCCQVIRNESEIIGRVTRPLASPPMFIAGPQGQRAEPFAQAFRLAGHRREHGQGRNGNSQTTRNTRRCNGRTHNHLKNLFRLLNHTFSGGGPGPGSNGSTTVSGPASLDQMKRLTNVPEMPVGPTWGARLAGSTAPSQRRRSPRPIRHFYADWSDCGSGMNTWGTRGTTREWGRKCADAEGSK
jgi:hypothetical protein